MEPRKEGRKLSRRMSGIPINRFRGLESEFRKRNLSKQQGRGLAVSTLRRHSGSEARRWTWGRTAVGGRGVGTRDREKLSQHRRRFCNLVHHHGPINQTKVSVNITHTIISHLKEVTHTLCPD